MVEANEIEERLSHLRDIYSRVEGGIHPSPLESSEFYTWCAVLKTRISLDLRTEESGVAVSERAISEISYLEAKFRGYVTKYSENRNRLRILKAELFPN